MKQAEHVILRARYSVLRLKKNKSLISGLLFEGAEKFQVKVYNNSLNSNHIHLLVKAPSQKKTAQLLKISRRANCPKNHGCRKRQEKLF
jgi:REP element-mobilizing transposase RayT